MAETKRRGRPPKSETTPKKVEEILKELKNNKTV